MVRKAAAWAEAVGNTGAKPRPRGQRVRVDERFSRWNALARGQMGLAWDGGASPLRCRVAPTRRSASTTPTGTNISPRPNTATQARKSSPTDSRCPKGGGQYLVGHPYRIAGHTYVPAENESYTAVGMASWYGAAFHGRRTANGEVYDMASITAAHPTMPLPSYARVTNLSNGYSVIVRVNDRGPYHGGRVMDVSSRTADVLGFKGEGTAKIKVEYVGRAPLEGSDDGALLASLRTDGSPANLNGYSSPVMVASASEPGPSVFAGLFGSGRSEPPAPPGRRRRPDPTRADPRRRRAASPAAEPIREAPAGTGPGSRRGPAPWRRTSRAAPFRLPPPRPFDLGAVTRLGRRRRRVAVEAAADGSLRSCRRGDRSCRRARKRRSISPTAPSDRVEPLTSGAFDRVKPGQGPSNED